VQPFYYSCIILKYFQLTDNILGELGSLLSLVSLAKKRKTAIKGLFAFIKANKMKFNLNFFETELYQIAKQPLALEEGRRAYVFLAQEYTAEELDFLAKIMQAVGLSLEKDVQVVPCPPEQSFQLQKKPLAPCFFFGLSTAFLGLRLELPLYQLVYYQDLQLLRGISLQQIALQKQHKLALWRALQEIFPSEK